MIAEQFAKAGISKAEAQFRVALTKFMNGGGSIFRANEILLEVASPSQRKSLKKLLNNELGGHENRASAGQTRCAPDSFPNRDAGQVPSAKNAASDPLPDITNPKAPGHAKRGIRSIASVQAPMARSLFDKTVLPDGRRLRHVRWNECPELSRKYGHLSRMFDAIHKSGQPHDFSTTLDNVITESQLSDIITSTRSEPDV